MPAYLFFGDALVPLAADAERWDESVWAPGQELTWEVIDGPGWTAPLTHERSGTVYQPELESVQEAVPVVAEALGFWSAVQSADINWSVSGVAADLVTGEGGDERPTVFLVPDYPPRASITYSHGKIIDCEVLVTPNMAVHFPSRVWVRVLAHEFGHCVGLGHSGDLPRFPPGSSLAFTGAFGVQSIMAGFNYRGDWKTLALDDVVGASLLRPRPGWVAGTGRIAGVVTVADAPAPFAQVFAFPVAEGRVTGPVGVFANEDGAFLVEGLAPGRYLLWAGPIEVLATYNAFFGLPNPPILDLTEHVHLLPVDVSPGRTTDGIHITLRRNRPPLAEW